MLTPKTLNVEFASSLGRLRTGDPTTRFSDSMRHIGISLDTRTDDELISDARNHRDAAVREQALYSFAHRKGAEALPVLKTAVLTDADSQLRVNVLRSEERRVGNACRS